MILTNMCLLIDGAHILALENKGGVCLKEMCEEKSRKQVSKREGEKISGQKKTSAANNTVWIKTGGWSIFF